MRIRATLVLIATPLIACDVSGRPDTTATVEAQPSVRAAGNEPFWNVDISQEGGLVYNRLGDEPIVFPFIAPEITTGDRTAYAYGPVEDATGAHVIRVVITDEPCQDTMADQVHPMTSSATVDGEELYGCARPLELRPEEPSG